MQVFESEQMVTVIVEEAVAGNPDASLFVYEPFLRGEDYPVLVRIWDNQDDDNE